MVISVRQISEKCLRPRGPLSIVRNILGYNGPGVPQATSLIEELRRFRDLEHVILRIKIVSTPTWAFGDTTPVDEMIFSMRLVFGRANVAVLIGSTENLMLANADIDVGDCKLGGSSVDLDTLFTNINDVNRFEIVVYFVRTVRRGAVSAWDGCAAHPTDVYGATVARTANRWTLAHEVGHVFGLRHIEGVDENCPISWDPPEPDKCILTNVMTCCGTWRISATLPGTIPTFDHDQGAGIKLSPMTERCAA